jgi:hypothetical protein
MAIFSAAPLRRLVKTLPSLFGPVPYCPRFLSVHGNASHTSRPEDTRRLVPGSPIAVARGTLDALKPCRLAEGRNMGGKG